MGPPRVGALWKPTTSQVAQMRAHAHTHTFCWSPAWCGPQDRAQHWCRRCWCAPWWSLCHHRSPACVQHTRWRITKVAWITYVHEAHRPHVRSMWGMLREAWSTANNEGACRSSLRCKGAAVHLLEMWDSVQLALNAREDHNGGSHPGRVLLSAHALSHHTLSADNTVHHSNPVGRLPAPNTRLASGSATPSYTAEHLQWPAGWSAFCRALHPFPEITLHNVRIGLQSTERHHLHLSLILALHKVDGWLADGDCKPAHLGPDRALHYVHSGLQDVAALRRDELCQRARKEAAVCETQTPIPARMRSATNTPINPWKVIQTPPQRTRVLLLEPDQLMQAATLLRSTSHGGRVLKQGQHVQAQGQFCL